MTSFKGTHTFTGSTINGTPAILKPINFLGRNADKVIISNDGDFTIDVTIKCKGSEVYSNAFPLYAGEILEEIDIDASEITLTYNAGVSAYRVKVNRRK